MNPSLRLFLLLSAAVVLIVVIRKIHKSEFEIIDSVFWFLFVGMLTIVAAFPQIVFPLSSLFGFESPSNFVFLVVVAVLLVRTFTLNAKVAHLRSKINTLIQEIAIRDYFDNE